METRTAPPTTAPTTRSVIGPALGAGALAGAASVYATFVASPWKHNSADWGIEPSTGVPDLVITAAIIGLAVAVVFGVVARRALGQPVRRTARTALVLAITAVVLTPFAFWSGLPIVLGGATMLLGLDSSARLGRTPVTTMVAYGLAGLATFVSLFLCLAG